MADTQNADVIDPNEPEVELTETQLDQEMSLEKAIIRTTRGATLNNPRVLMAIEAIETGIVPPSAIKTRPGASGGEVKYVAHTWATRTLNAAYRWLWDYEILEWHVSMSDGSVATRCQLTLHIPLPTGGFYTRRVTEIGSFEAYPKKDNNGKPILMNGLPTYTMNEADRIASSASRGLVKCVLRAFNMGLELSEKDTDNVAVTDKDAWNALFRFGKNQGLTRDQITEALKGKIAGTELASRFGEAYRLIYDRARGNVKEDIPTNL
jgi:hypothetical protein